MACKSLNWLKGVRWTVSTMIVSNSAYCLLHLFWGRKNLMRVNNFMNKNKKAKSPQFMYDSCLCIPMRAA